MLTNEKIFENINYFIIINRVIKNIEKYDIN